MPEPQEPNPDQIQAFIDRWQHADGSERANYQLFLTQRLELRHLRGDAGGIRAANQVSFH